MGGPEAPSRVTALRLEVRSLIDAGDLMTAEAVVRRELKAERSFEALVVAADVFSRRHLVNETKDLLDEALELAPGNYLVHVRLTEHFGRIGLYPQALEAIVRARRLLPSGDVAAFVYCQELERVLRDRARGSFVHGSSLPKLLSRLRLFWGTDESSRSVETPAFPRSLEAQGGQAMR